MNDVHPGASSHLVARLLLMIGMICAVIAQLIGLRTQMALQTAQIGNMKELQTRLYKQTVVRLPSQKIEVEFDESLPSTAQRIAPKRKASGTPPDIQSSDVKALDEQPKLHIQQAIKSSHVPLNENVKASDEQLKLHIQQAINKSSQVPLNEKGQIEWDEIDHVYYYHTRKAGGTTLVQWVRAVAWKHNKTFSKDEGPVFDHDEWENDNRRVLFVTSLRPPVERVISSYTFDLDQHGVNKTLTKFADDCELHNTKRKTLYFDKKKRKMRGWIWICAAECYGKWFGSWPTPSLKANIVKASETLNNYELLWMKNLRNEEYMKWLLHRFNATDTPIKRKRTTLLPKPDLTQAELTHLKEINKWDEFMYEALQKKWEGIIKLNSTLI